MLRKEHYFAPHSCNLIAGVDEAGRGCLAGPVVAAAVILPPECRINGLKDSKCLRREQRNEVMEQIGDRAVALGVGVAPADLVDRVNVLESTKIASLSAIRNLDPQPDYILTDALRFKNLSIPYTAIIKGDNKCRAIAAASVVAKVHRDRLMAGYHQEYPLYSFCIHKGYGTRRHVKALEDYGPCTIHRLSFHGVCWFNQALRYSSTFTGLKNFLDNHVENAGAVREVEFELQRVRGFLPAREIKEIEMFLKNVSSMRP